MIAIDTNLVVRLITDDPRDQADRAERLLTSDLIYVSLTVLLETAWVLGKTYGMSRVDVAEATRAFVGLPNVFVEKRERVALALEWSRSGMDVADAFHLAGVSHCEALVTFDHDFIQRAEDVTAQPPVRAP